MQPEFEEETVRRMRLNRILIGWATLNYKYILQYCVIVISASPFKCRAMLRCIVFFFTVEKAVKQP